MIFRLPLTWDRGKMRPRRKRSRPGVPWRAHGRSCSSTVTRRHHLPHQRYHHLHHSPFSEHHAVTISAGRMEERSSSSSNQAAKGHLPPRTPAQNARANISRPKRPRKPSRLKLVPLSVIFPKKQFAGNFTGRTIARRSRAFEQYLAHLASLSSIRNDCYFWNFFTMPELYTGHAAIRGGLYNEAYTTLSNITRLQVRGSPLDDYSA